jgi:Tfp pilus assembly protein PilX
MQRHNERGIALLTTLMVMMLISALLVGFTAVVMSDQRYRFIDRDRGQAFYAASGGLEKLTADLGNLFLTAVAPTQAQLTALTTSTAKPVISGITFTAPLTPDTLPTSALTRCAAPNAAATVGTPGYTLRYCATPAGTPTTSTTAPIKTGPYEGLIALQMPFQLDVSARTATNGEAHLVRSMEAVAIPVFQFGIFSDVDLSFFAGPNFSFGGRVHTNGNLFLSQGTGATLTLSDKVTAVQEIVRQRMQNGVSIDTAPAHAGTVNMAQSPGVYRALLRTEGSVVDGLQSALNEPLWHSTSLSTYNSWIRNGRTGARPLNLALIMAGGTNAALIRRPPANEDNTNPVLLGERLFTKASLRIMLSDNANDITSLPGVTPAAPVQLDGAWRTTPVNNGVGTYTFDPTHPPVARVQTLATAQITGGAANGTNRTLTVAAGVPAFFKVPDTIQVTQGASVWTLTGCSATKTAIAFTCTAVNPAHGANTAMPATVSADVATVDGNVNVQTPLTATWNGGSLTVSANTMLFAPESFFVNNDLVSCGGYTATTFTNCTLPNTIAAPATLTTASASTAGTGSIGGFIKMERGNADGTWTDVTMEILNYGIAGPNLAGTNCDPAGNLSNSIVRLQRLRDNNWATCPYPQGANSVSTDYWPNVLFDTREALQRDVAAGTLVLGGAMHYVSVDATNLSRWFMGLAPYNLGTGNLSKTDNGGYTLYFSDRRNNRDAASLETGDYGWEDFINPNTNGVPNNALDPGEDVNQDNVFDVYGGVPNYNGQYNTVPPGALAPLTTAAGPTTGLTRGEAQVNRAILFRRALKLTNGTNIRAATGITGLSVVSENPVYVQGDWNAPGGTFASVHAATAVMADSVTLLSNAWTDTISFTTPYVSGGRSRGAPTWYRLAIISGKGIAFANPPATVSDFGTDGGAHNFLRYLESGGFTVNYRGSMATFFFNRQGTGTYKCCVTVYGAPPRAYAFDVDFLNPALLPPNTPMFRDLNAVGFAQDMRPGR